jgi:hypothetical protein
VKWFDTIALSIRGTIADLRHRAGGKRRTRGPRIRYERVDEFPELLNSATLYVAGEEPHIWAAAMLCPCGCGDVIELNLLREASPCWTVRQRRDGSVTLMPSIWRTKGCRSHFLIRNSRIDWCRFEKGSPSKSPRDR